MALQTQVNTELSVAVAGQKATPDQSIYTPINYVAGEGGVSAGGFAFASSDDANVALSSGDTVLGFVERVISSYLYDVAETGTLTVHEGDGLTIAVKGDYYAIAPATVAVGDAVYVDTTTGALASSGTDTGWVYKQAGDEGDTVIISNWA